MTTISRQLLAEESQREEQAAGSLAHDVLEAIESWLPSNISFTAETGCGRSTILFSNLASDHTVFCLDDTGQAGSSVDYCRNSAFFNSDHVSWVFGPTQQTLLHHSHPGNYDCVLIDGPHGYPFPDLEYFFFYPLVKQGGLLIIDVVQIATIGQLADFLQEDDMWELVELVRTTAIFRRTDVPVFTTVGDDWWTQKYNQRRAEKDNPFYLDDDGKLEPFSRKVERYYSRQARMDFLGKIKFRLFRLLGINDSRTS